VNSVDIGFLVTWGGTAAQTAAGRALTDGRPLHLVASAVHTITVESDEAAWLVSEGPLSYGPSIAYNVPGWNPCPNGLYVQMTRDELKSCEAELGPKCEAIV
jgi:hypothetical protein